MQHKDKVTQLRDSMRAKKEAEDRRQSPGSKGLSPGQADQFKHKIQELEQSLEKALGECEEFKKKAKENHENFLRTYADLENYRKRVAKEKEEINRYGAEKLVKELLPALDSLEKALEHADESSDFKSLVDGVELVLKQFLQALGKFGLDRLEAAGKPFDPNYHEAMAHHESGEHEPDTVVHEHRRGYKLHDRLLRPALVTVSKPPEKK